eukprot:928999-Prymnesium_polylepis.1
MEPSCHHWDGGWSRAAITGMGGWSRRTIIGMEGGADVPSLGWRMEATCLIRVMEGGGDATVIGGQRLEGTRSY